MKMQNTDDMESELVITEANIAGAYFAFMKYGTCKKKPNHKPRSLPPFLNSRVFSQMYSNILCCQILMEDLFIIVSLYYSANFS